MSQVFISYSHKDLPWAEAIHKRLTDDEFACFFDKASLRAGDDWEDRILSNLDDSQHLLVLLSKAAKESDWVQREYNTFFALINHKRDDKRPARRQLIFLLLDEDDVAYRRVQKITDFKDAGVYPGDVSNVSKALWNKVINQVEVAINDDPNTTPIYLAVFALTENRFNYLYNGNIDDFATRVNDSLTSIGIDYQQSSILNAFRQRYGQKATDWKPFDGGETVDQILIRVMEQINNGNGTEGERFRWNPIGEKFYTGNDKEVRDEIRNLESSSLSVFVIDPISLLDTKMVVKLGLLDDFFEDEKTLILLLTPVIPSHYVELVQLIQSAANSFFNRFYDSPIRKGYAHCGINICDERDVGRFMRVAVSKQIYSRRKSGSNVFTNHG
jgi:hypothetical protein